MERVIERCAGLDVHKKTVAACVRVRGTQHVRTFGTTATELLVLRDWLFAHEVTHVAMESTGVYWKPIFYVLEDAFTCVLSNADRREGLHVDRTTAGARADSGEFRAAGADPRAARPYPLSTGPD